MASLGNTFNPGTDPHLQDIYKMISDIVIDIGTIQSQINQLITDMNGHKHSGVTTGSGNTGVVSTSATSVVVKTVK